MNLISPRKAWTGTIAAGVAGVLGFTALTSSAPGDTAKRGVPTITMEYERGAPPRFEGPSEIFEGSSLRVLNNTRPERIGPHTFTLVKKGLRPDDRKSARACAEGESKVCKRVFRAHQVDFQNQTVGKELVAKGQEGWDMPFTNRASGDSWFTQAEGDDVVQSVPLAAGENLFYFCVIHPEMQGKLKVVSAP